jgi:hypothetical protein
MPAITLNDRRDEVFVDIHNDDDPREQAANKFAKDFLIPPTHARDLQTIKSMTAVRTFAQRNGAHSGIVVGRLNHEKIISFSYMQDLLVRLDWAEACVCEFLFQTVLSFGLFAYLNDRHTMRFVIKTELKIVQAIRILPLTTIGIFESQLVENRS